MPNSQTSFSRGEFVRLSWVGLLSLGTLTGLAAFLRFLSFQSQPKLHAPIDLGAKQDYPPGSVTALAEQKVIVVNGEDGLVALDTTCTHLGCQVRLEAGELACPCHGSKFDLSGTPTHGPAKEPLKRWQIEETQAGELILHFEEEAS